MFCKAHPILTCTVTHSIMSESDDEAVQRFDVVLKGAASISWVRMLRTEASCHTCLVVTCKTWVLRGSGAGFADEI